MGEKDITESEIPMMMVAKNLNGLFPYIYGTIILVAMYTSAVSNVYGFLQNTRSLGKNNMKLLALLCVSIIVSSMGFTNLISILYPIFGYLGITQMFFLFMA